MRYKIAKTRSGMPKRVCVLDCETSKAKPETAELYFAGVKTYVFGKNRYFSGHHRVFLRDQLSALEKFLDEFDGIIIGHNIFDFDYRVLMRFIVLKRVVPKTVDTLAVLYRMKDSEMGV